VRKEIDNILEEYFKEGKRIEIASIKEGKRIEAARKSKKERAKKNEQKESDSTIMNMMNQFFSIESRNSREGFSEKDFDPESPLIKFDEKSEANEFMERIEKSMRNVMKAAEENLKSCIQCGIDEFSKEFEKYRTESSEKIRASVQRNIDGFD